MGDKNQVLSLQGVRERNESNLQSIKLVLFMVCRKDSYSTRGVAFVLNSWEMTLQESVFINLGLLATPDVLTMWLMMGVGPYSIYYPKEGWKQKVAAPPPDRLKN